MNLRPMRSCASYLFQNGLCVALLFGWSHQMLKAEEVSPLPNAHFHNDYEHSRPLLDALDQGFCSVEADVYLVDGRLLVAHALAQTRPDRDLDSLYLAPLHERVKRNGGRVHREHPEFFLLIDIKCEAAPTYGALKALLAKHAEMLTTWEPDGVHPGAVTVILSGTRPTVANLLSEKTRFVAIDGRTKDLEGNAPSTVVPLISDRWGALFKWRGAGPMPKDECARLNGMVQKAHAQGRKIRFWAIPDNPAGWAALRQAGVDLINTDHLPELRQYLLANECPLRKD